MRGNNLKIANGAAAGAWIRPRLVGQFGAVTLQVPSGFERYARVFHPALDRQGNRASWAEVAEACGTTAHQAMQWHAILGLRTADELRGSYRSNDGSGVKWEGSDPPVGAMDVSTLDALCGVLAEHTVDPTHCFFGLCTIRTWLDSFSADEMPPLLELPFDRSHIVLTAPLSAVDQIVYDWSNSTEMNLVGKKNQESPAEQNPYQLLRREAPNLIWPADQSWFVATEVDFDSTLVGGSTLLIESVVKSPKLEAWQVDPTDSLADDADNVNSASEL